MSNVFGPAVLDSRAAGGNCACGEKRPHLHDVSALPDVQKWRTGKCVHSADCEMLAEPGDIYCAACRSNIHDRW